MFSHHSQPCQITIVLPLAIVEVALAQLLGCSSTCPDGSERWFSWQQAMTLLDAIPGVARRSAELLLAEVGVDMGRFPSSAHLCKWAGICPGNYESARKQYSDKVPPSNRWLRGMLVQMANAAVCCKTSYFASVYRRLAARRGHKRAIVGVAHRLLIAVYHMLKQHQPYRDYRASDAGQYAQEQRLKRLQQQVERLGYQVQL
ncbi:hypothetical protein AVDCRST_MAG94-5560, partial [uncultured Leptolyngbya sp.]